MLRWIVAMWSWCQSLFPPALIGRCKTCGVPVYEDDPYHTDTHGTGVTCARCVGQLRDAQ